MRLYPMETIESLLISLSLYAAMLAVVFFSIRKPRLSRFFKAVSLKKPRWPDLPNAIVFAGILIVASIAVAAVFTSMGWEKDLEKVPDALKQSPVISLFIIITAASIIEEIFFRGFLQPRTSILFSAFVFSYFHIIYGSLTELAGTFVLGLILGKQFQRTKSLFPCMLSHFIYNSLTLAVVFFSGA